MVIELGSGYGRNWSLLREHFPHAIVCQYEQSQANINIAINKMHVPREHCMCISVQHIEWSQLSKQLDIIVDWWTLSYLKPHDVVKVLQGVRLALKPNGIFIVCLPVKIRDASRNGPSDKGMVYRTVKWYDQLFKMAGLVHLFPDTGETVYTPSGPNMQTDYGREAVWILSPEI